MGRLGRFTALNCSVNPEAGRESDVHLRPVLPHHAKEVLVIGGGLAGMESARVLAERGHHPVVVEASSTLGGVVVAGGQPPFKEDDLALLDWYRTTLAELDVEVRLDTAATPDLIAETNADHIILATGAVPRSLDLGNSTPVVDATTALLDTARLGRRVVIVGGGLTGCELAVTLRQSDVEVSIVEVCDRILTRNAPLCAANEDMLRALVDQRGVRVLTNTTAVATTEHGLQVCTGDQHQELAADTVVLAIGYEARQDLRLAVERTKVPYHVVGDARKPSNIMYAIWDAYEVASVI